MEFSLTLTFSVLKLEPDVLFPGRRKRTSIKAMDLLANLTLKAKQKENEELKSGEPWRDDLQRLAGRRRNGKGFSESERLYKRFIWRRWLVFVKGGCSPPPIDKRSR
ncbi:hypothetical protein V6N13_057829 [Hibiscus sabdariffa]|uniref:Uncharacterized protein n=1 Tax=Hibiscus sabdariffa TaxID=183260 RepID=A0ABR2GHZ3_9ROSI